MTGDRPGTTVVGRAALVTGGSGFIGRHVARCLALAGAEVRVLDTRPFPRIGASWEDRIDSREGSVTDAATVQSAMAGAPLVFHLAGNPNLWARDREAFERVNLVGTQTVIAAAERAGVERLVYTSTESILKSRRKGRNDRIDETVEVTAGEMCGSYCLSKYLAEQEALAAARRGVPVIVVNPTLPVGPGDTNVTPPTRMILDFVNGRHPAFLDFQMNLIDVRDIAQGHLLAAAHGRVGERYILGNVNMRLSDLLGMLGEITGLPMPQRRVPYPVAWMAAAVSELVSDWITRRPPAAPLTGVRLAGSDMVFDSAKARREIGLPQHDVYRAVCDALSDLKARGLIERPLGKPLPQPSGRVDANGFDPLGLAVASGE